MKTTGENTRMIQVAPGEWAEVRAGAIEIAVQHHRGGFSLVGAALHAFSSFEHLGGKRVLILELAD